MMDMPEYKQHMDHTARVTSAVSVINALLPLDLCAAHKRELLRICVCKIMGADGKYKVRYWSEDSIGQSMRLLNHEHVYGNQELIQRLLSGEPVDTVAIDAVVCMVTKEEHGRLEKSDASGWLRYKDAGINVYDSGKHEWMVFHEPGPRWK